MMKRIVFLLSIIGVCTIAGASSSPLTGDGECDDQSPSQLRAQATNSRFYSSRPLANHFGIEALDIDLSDPSLINDEQFISQLKQDLVRHRAILFRSQNLSGQQQVDISEALGTIAPPPKTHLKSPHPYISRVSNNSTEGSTGVGTYWHADGIVLKTPFMYSTMYFPSVIEGGDTYFLPIKELYESFSEDEKAYYNKLWMIYEKGTGTSHIHPLVYKHPFRPNDEQTMLFHFANKLGYFVDANVSKNNGENEAVFNGVDRSKWIRPKVVQNLLSKKIESLQDGIVMQMKWQKGDFFIFDQLGVLHRASKGTQKRSEDTGLRILHRTSILGGEETVPTKLDGRKSFVLPTAGRD